MPRRVLIAPAAAGDLRDARRWLLQPGSGPDARRRWEALKEVPRGLLDHPYRGRASADHPGYRELAVSGYRLLYQVRPDTGDAATAGDVEIVRVFGPGQLGRSI
jgi:plasmid stabilization system protein ParE